MRWHWVMVGLVLASGAAIADDHDEPLVAPLLPFEANYEVRRNGKEIGRASLALELLESGRLRYHLSTQGTRGLARWLAVKLDETSEAEWHDGRWRPVNYTYRERMRMRKRNRSATFDWDAGQASGVNRDDEWVTDIHDGVLDSRLLELILAQDVYAGGTASSLKYDVLRKGRLKPYHFRVRSKETLPGPDGEPLRAHVVERVDDRRDRQMRLWLSQELGHAPLRARYEDDDESLELKMIDYRGADGTVLSKL